jgi:NAD(P)-dependent dehydrogenase (short-subunit alcohol dehydrogenase family)
MALAKLKSIQSMYDLRGKVSVVTGSAGGMGKAISYRLADCKSHVVVRI